MKKRLLLSAAALVVMAMAAGCTADGKGFDDPAGEMSVVGTPNEGCDKGRTFLFGNARNTGDLELRNISVIAACFDGGGFAGRFEAPVSRGVETVTLEDGETVEEIDVIVDTLAVDEQGSFHVDTTVPCGRLVRAEYSFTFTSETFEEF